MRRSTQRAKRSPARRAVRNASRLEGVMPPFAARRRSLPWPSRRCRRARYRHRIGHQSSPTFRTGQCQRDVQQAPVRHPRSFMMDLPCGSIRAFGRAVNPRCSVRPRRQSGPHDTFRRSLLIAFERHPRYGLSATASVASVEQARSTQWRRGSGMSENNEGEDPTPSESDQILESDRQSPLESRRRFVRNTLVAGGLIAASLRTAVRPALGQTTTLQPTTTVQPTTTTLQPTTTLGPTTTTLQPTTTLGPTTTTLQPTTTLGPTTTAAPLPSTATPTPAMTVGGLAAVAAALGLIARKKLRSASTPDAEPSGPRDDSGDSD